MLSLGRPWALAFLALLALVAILYFLRMRFRRPPVGSAYVWRLLSGKNEGGRKVRRKSIVLLVLQLVAVAVAAFALASPELARSRPSEPGVAYLVDVSASMGARSGGSGGEDRLAEAARLVMEDAASLAPSRPVAVFACSHGARRVSGPGEGRGSLRSALASLAASDSALEEEAVAADLSAWLASRPEPWEARAYGDGGWSLGGERVRAVFSDAVRSVSVGAATGDLGVHGLRVEKDEAGGAEARFSIVNSWDEERPYRASLSRDGAAVAEASGVARKGTSAVSLRLEGGVADGGYAITLIDAADGYGADDSAYCAIGPAPRARVLALARPGPYFTAAFAGAGADLATRDPAAPIAREECELALLPLADYRIDPPCDVLFVSSSPPADGVMAGSVSGSEPGHPLSRFVRWDGAPAEAAVAVPATSGARVLARAGDVPVIAAWESGGFKRVAFGFDPFDQRIGLSPSFPLFVRDLLEWCAPGTGGSGAYAFTAGRSEARAIGNALEFADSSAFETWTEGGVRYALALRRGLHEAKVPGAGGRAAPIAVNLPLSELDLAPRALLMPAEPAPLAASSSGGPREITAAAAALLALLLALEWALWRGAPALKARREGGNR